MVSFILLPVIPILTDAVWMDESLNIHSSWRHVGFIAMQNLHFHFLCVRHRKQEKVICQFIKKLVKG